MNPLRWLSGVIHRWAFVPPPADPREFIADAERRHQAQERELRFLRLQIRSMRSAEEPEPE